MSPSPQQSLRAGLYCRISSDPNDRREGVDRQRADTSALCELKGWSVAGYYVDNDRSASNGKDRPEWERLLADVKAGTIDAIAAWDQDRGWRMMSELETLRRFFTDVGRQIPLATTGQGDIDLYLPTGVLAAQIKTAVSEHEIAMMKVRMRRAAKDRAEKGVPQWRNAFGFLPDGSREPDPVTAPLVRQVYADILAGGSISEAARMLNAQKAFSLKGAPWSAPTLSLFLRNPRNAGLRAHNKELVIGADGETVKGSWPPLVDESTWRATQAVLNGPGRGAGSRRTIRKHLLTGVLRCGKCGYHLSGKHTPDKKIAYGCSKCHGVTVHAEYVEPLLYDVVAERLARPNAVHLLRAEIHDEAIAEAQRRELSALYGEIDAVALERAEGLITSREMKVINDATRAKIERLERVQQDAEKLRVFEGIPLGTPEVRDAVRKLPVDRFKAVVSVLLTVTVQPVGKGGRVFDKTRVINGVEWKV